MAFAAQTVTPNSVGLGYVRARHTSGGTPVTIGRVKEVMEIDLTDNLYEHRAWNATGAEQIAKVFKTGNATGRVKLLLDEIPDVDATTWTGEQVDVDLTQIFPNASTTGWRILYAKAYLRFTKLKPNFAEPSTVEMEIIPYNDPGTAPYTFTQPYTV